MSLLIWQTFHIFAVNIYIHSNKLTNSAADGSRLGTPGAGEWDALHTPYLADIPEITGIIKCVTALRLPQTEHSFAVAYAGKAGGGQGMGKGWECERARERKRQLNSTRKYSRIYVAVFTHNSMRSMPTSNLTAVSIGRARRVEAERG